MLEEQLRGWNGEYDRYIEPAEPAFQMALGPNEEMNSRVVRYVYASLTTPNSTYDYDLDTGREVSRLPVEFGVDYVVRRRHRREGPMLVECVTMEGERIGRTQPQKELESEYQETDVVQLTDDRNEIGNEVEW